MKRPYLTMTMLAGLALAGAGWANAQTQTQPKAHDMHHDATPAKAATASDGMGKMGMGMMGGDGGMCPMMGGGMGAMMGMGGSDTQVAVKNTDKGVTITLTTTDPAKIPRLQKMAEAMRLMHEATAP